ncbi:hypothetical protein Dimus_029640 [Dionaea muscipula]
MYQCRRRGEHGERGEHSERGEHGERSEHGEHDSVHTGADVSIVVNRAGLRHFLDSFGATEQSIANSNPLAAGISQEPALASAVNDKQDNKAKADTKTGHVTSGMDSVVQLGLRKQGRSTF